MIDGRNIWRAGPDALLTAGTDGGLGEQACGWPLSCLLLHVPVDLAASEKLDDSEVKNLAGLCRAKLNELKLLARGLNHGAVQHRHG